MQRALQKALSRRTSQNLASRQIFAGVALSAEAARVGSDLERWKLLLAQGAHINPCNSRLHPAARAGLVPVGEDEQSVQEAYTPDGQCFGCGPSSEGGLHMRSFRTKDGLESWVSFPAKYSAFPGILNGGLVSAAFECQGNWTAAVALMDRSSLPKPPMTLTAELLVQHRRPCPPDTDIVLRSHVLEIRGGPSAGYPGTGGKVAVEVELNLMLPEGGRSNLVSTARGIFKRVAAVRAL
ncbi:hypothetical protein WJX74_007402 [Apatococcus lobatus]|uniref:Thioesterase domain-containing protein n=1 Tax=Apatococcus lobatus TaxID=904363 RepID=A0AAW1QB42_9CHLO